MCPRERTAEPKLLFLVSLSQERLPHTLIPVIASTYYGKCMAFFFLGGGGGPVYLFTFHGDSESALRTVVGAVVECVDKLSILGEIIG